MRSGLYRFSIDVFNWKIISGWCYRRLQKKQPVVLQFKAGGRLLGEAKAELYREDIYAQRAHPSGQCGFTFIIPREAVEKDEAISIFTEDGRTLLKKLTSGDRFRVVNRSRSPGRLLRDLYSSLLPGNRSTVFFMHIPKTAGTSFNSYARTLFPAHSSVSHIKAYRPEEYSRLIGRKRYISGHITIGEIARNFDLHTLELYSLLRDPYKQLHSHLNWLRRMTQENDSTFFAKHNDEQQAIALHYRNWDFSRLETLEHFVHSLSGLAREMFENCQSRYFLSERIDKVGSDQLGEILANARQFTSIGITEEYDRFVNCFTASNGRKRSAGTQEKALNTSRLERLFDADDPSVRKVLLPLVEVDLKLYEKVQENGPEKPLKTD